MRQPGGKCQPGGRQHLAADHVRAGLDQACVEPSLSRALQPCWTLQWRVYLTATGVSMAAPTDTHQATRGWANHSKGRLTRDRVLAMASFVVPHGRPCCVYCWAQPLIAFWPGSCCNLTSFYKTLPFMTCKQLQPFKGGRVAAKAACCMCCYW